MLSNKTDFFGQTSSAGSTQFKQPSAKLDLQDPDQLSKVSTNIDSKRSISCKSIGDYCIRQTLGTGTFSKTKLGIHKTTG